MAGERKRESLGRQDRRGRGMAEMRMMTKPLTREGNGEGEESGEREKGEEESGWLGEPRGRSLFGASIFFFSLQMG